MTCGPNEKDITQEKFGAKIGISVITIIYMVFIMFVFGVIMSIRDKGTLKSKSTSNTNSQLISSKLTQIFDFIKSIKKGNISNKPVHIDTFTSRFTEWFTRVGNLINSGSVLAILAAGVIIGFNSYIMTPIISTMFPIDITQPMDIPGRVSTINPGQFFIAFIGFIISLILFFFVAEIIYIIKGKFKQSLTIIFIFILFAFLTFMLVWNAIEADKLFKQNDCVPIDLKTSAFQFRNKGIEGNNVQSPPPFGIFG